MWLLIEKQNVKLLLLPEQLSTSIFTWSPISSPEIRSGRRVVDAVIVTDLTDQRISLPDKTKPRVTGFSACTEIFNYSN